MEPFNRKWTPYENVGQSKMAAKTFQWLSARRGAKWSSSSKNNLPSRELMGSDMWNPGRNTVKMLVLSSEINSLIFSGLTRWLNEAQRSWDPPERAQKQKRKKRLASCQCRPQQAWMFGSSESFSGLRSKYVRSMKLLQKRNSVVSQQIFMVF